AEDSPSTGSRPTDRNWQFREFRNVSIQKLKDMLTDDAAIEAYKKDPFNPHAIARLRISAYQKAVVMRYIDNLMDWGDDLFTKDTRESINEAQMLYQLAADILGRRPAKQGKCDTMAENDLTYEKLGPLIASGSEFLIALEHLSLRVRSREFPDMQAASTTKQLNAVVDRVGGFHQPQTFGFVRDVAAVNRISDYTNKW